VAAAAHRVGASLGVMEGDDVGQVGGRVVLHRAAAGAGTGGLLRAGGRPRRLRLAAAVIHVNVAFQLWHHLRDVGVLMPTGSCGAAAAAAVPGLHGLQGAFIRSGYGPHKHHARGTVAAAACPVPPVLHGRCTEGGDLEFEASACQVLPLPDTAPHCS